MSMRAAIWTGYGPPAEVLSVGEIDTPVPGDDEVLVRVEAASIHAGDWLEVTGTPYAVRLASGLPRPRRVTPGRDLAGRVEAVGRKVEGMVPGDEVFGECLGALAGFAAGEPGRLAPMPEGLTFEEAAALPVSGVTALKAMRDVGEVGPGSRVLIVGASGGVGSFAVQIAKALGAEVTGVCSTPNVDAVLSMGADRVVDYTREPYTEGGDRFDVVLDNAASASLGDLRRLVVPGGVLIPNNGTTGGRWFGTIGRILRAALISPFVKQQLKPFFATTSRADLEALAGLVESGKVRAPVAAVFGLEQVADAFDLVGTGHAGGKVIVRMGQ
jgi:NADPH:quinone reductase-like Zn-dependent oxidoreductase